MLHLMNQKYGALFQRTAKQDPGKVREKMHSVRLSQSSERA